MRARAPALTLLAGRAFMEAVAFAALAALIHSLVLGAAPLAILPAAVGLFGVILVLSAVLAESRAERQSTVQVVIVIGAAVVWGLSLPMRGADGLAVLTRGIAFAFLGEAFLWRVLSLARTLGRWHDARDACGLALLSLVLLAIIPLPVDRGSLAMLGLLVVATAGLTLSLARSAEEQQLAHDQARGGTAAVSATAAAFILGAVAIVVAAFLPAAQDALADLGRAAEPVLSRALYAMLLPFGYLAAYLVEVFSAWFRSVDMPPPRPPPARPDADEEAVRAALEHTRPFVFGAVEVLVALVGVLVALLLVDRLMRERRAALPEGSTIERERADGLSLRASLATLLPQRRQRRRAPSDDGSLATGVRLLYWRFLALAEGRGAGWRTETETPSEHLSRIAAASPEWLGARPVVAAFEELRYAERVPDAARIDAARQALRSLTQRQ
ncbi:MAG: DUF4129 domain-containing protein [Chloroflexota bacterium]|nr:DUF4129 domain-containing protein [Chloroflexota bacterium]